jgi:outer membrane protein assembly factor BamD
MGNTVRKVLLVSFLFIFLNGYAEQIVSYSSTVSSSSGFGGMNERVILTPDDSIPPPNKDKKEKKKKSSEGKVTFETFDKNYQKAVKYYNNGQFLSAAHIFEELYPLSMGTSSADSILFLFADCYYQNKNYEMAAFHFKDYTRRFPGSPRAEDAYFKCVKAIYNLSPYYSLDQFETKYAIEEIDLFSQVYPHSKYSEECNLMLDELRDKLALKDFEIIKLYYNTDHYQAAQIACRNFMKDYPYSKYAPEALFILIKNNLEFAKKSIDSKKTERYQACLDAYETMKMNYSDSQFIELAKDYIDQANKNLKKYKVTK